MIVHRVHSMVLGQLVISRAVQDVKRELRGTPHKPRPINPEDPYFIKEQEDPYFINEQLFRDPCLQLQQPNKL